jgi:hypothetical protein
MKRLVLSFLLAMFALGACACESTGVGNPGNNMTVSVQNDLTAEPDATDAGSELEDSQVRHAVLAFGELHFIPCDPSDGDVTAPGPIVVDLVTHKTASLALPTVAIPPGGFCGLDAPLTTSAPNAALQGKSMLFSGLRNDGTLFILYAAMQGTLHMRPEPGVKWDASNASSVIWALRPRRWLAKAELDAETSEPLGTVLRIIVVDIDRHPVLYNAVRSRIGARSTLHTDLNDNHQLDDDERTSALIGQGLPSLD